MLLPNVVVALCIFMKLVNAVLSAVLPNAPCRFSPLPNCQQVHQYPQKITCNQQGRLLVSICSIWATLEKRRNCQRRQKVEVRPRTVEKYLTADGHCPFDEWFDRLGDRIGKAQIDARITRLRLGSLGNCDAVGEGVIELIFKNTGPGYRVYCGQDGPELVILLGGGTKRGQQADIDRAKAYWRDYKG